MSGFVDLVDQRIRIHIMDDALDTIEKLSRESWRAGHLLNLHQGGALSLIYLGRAVCLRVTDDANDSYPIGDDWMKVQSSHWRDLEIAS